MIPQTSSKNATTNNAGYNSNGSSSHGSNNHQKPACDSEKNASANSGYSADGSASALAPPIYIGFLEANKRSDNEDCSNSNTSHNRSNRRKTIELNFTASRAMDDLKRGGVAVPAIRMEKSRDLDGCKIDMTKVKLVMSKSTAASPFLINRANQDLKLVPNSDSEYEQLFAATYQSYEKHETNHCDSSTSSVSSSSESDDVASMPPPALVVPPLLEDALKADAAGEAKKLGSRRKRPICTEIGSTKAAKLNHITMNEALEASAEARVVTLSFHPFIVVHVNTAYNRLTGYSSAKVLGRPLQDCLSGSCKEWMKIGAPHPVAALHDRVGTIRSKGNKHQQCKCHAILVGPQLEGNNEVDTGSVTHYAVCFLPVPDNNNNKNAAGGRDIQFRIAGDHRQVMG